MAPSDPEPRTGATAPRRRDATATRGLLLQVARRRFAHHGYAATTVRDIANEAGVNVALINRYFESKEGLFAACLAIATNDLAEPDERNLRPADIPTTIARQIAGTGPANRVEEILLLLRSSGDERGDEIRRSSTAAFAQRLAAVAAPDSTLDAEQLLLHSQLVVAAAIGFAVVRTTLPIAPLAEADEEALLAPIAAMVRALLQVDGQTQVAPRPPASP